MHTFNIRFILYVLSVFLAIEVNAQQYNVKGTVYDQSNAEVLQNARVSIPGSDISVSTDLNGYFSLSSSSSFDSICVEMTGYARKMLFVGDHKEFYSIYLFSNSSLFQEVEVFGKQGKPFTTTISKTDLNRASGLNLQDALNTVPGVEMQSRTPWGGQHIIIRGYYPSTDNGRTNAENFNGLGYRLYINNIPVTDATGLTVMDDIDFSVLGKVDIVKGPSPLYGSYPGGAVNLYTPTPAAHETSLNEQLIAGSYGLLRSNTSMATSTEKSDFWINYGHQSYNGFRPNDSSRKDYLSFASNFYISSRHTLSVYFSYANSLEQFAGEIDSADFYNRREISDTNYLFNKSHAGIESYRAGITDKYRISDHFGNLTTFFAGGYTLDQYFAHGFGKNANLNFGGSTSFTYSDNGSRMDVNGVLGASFQKSKQSAQGNFILPFVLPPFTDSTKHMSASGSYNNSITSSVFTQWSFTLPTHWTLILGGSMNFVKFSTQNLFAPNGIVYLDNQPHAKTFDPVFMPGISISKSFKNNLTAYASYNAGYAPATISQMTTSNGKVDSTLKPEMATQVELGIKGTALLHHRLTYQLAVFDMDITNRLIQEYSNGVSYYTNAGEQRNLGAELYLSYNLAKHDATISMVRPWLSYTYSNFTYSDFKSHAKSHNGQDSIAFDYSNEMVAAISPNVINIGIDLASNFGVYLNTTFRYVDRAPVTFDNNHYMSPYSLLNGKIGYSHDFGKHINGNIFAGADNLLGSTYYSFIFVGQNIQELGQGTDPYIKGGGGDGYILPAPYKATFYGGLSLKYKF